MVNKRIVMIKYFTVVFFFISTTTIYYLSLKTGNKGITLNVFGGGDDGFFYWDQILNVINNEPWIRTSIYPLVMGKILKLFSCENVYFVRLVNIIIFFLYLRYTLFINKIISKEALKDVRLETKSQYVLIILNLLYLSLHLQVNISIYRDVWIFFLYTLSLFINLTLVHKKGLNRLLSAFLLIISLYFLGSFRGYVLLSYLVSNTIYIIRNSLKMEKWKVTNYVIVVIIFIIIFKYFLDFSIMDLSLRKALNYRSQSINYFSGGSNMYISLDTNNFLIFIFNYSKSVLGNMLAPLPWHIQNIKLLVTFLVETVPMIFILTTIYKHRNELSNNQKYLLTHSFVWIAFISITNDNIGTAIRLRPIAWMNIINVYSMIYVLQKERRNKI